MNSRVLCEAAGPDEISDGRSSDGRPPRGEPWALHAELTRRPWWLSGYGGTRQSIIDLVLADSSTDAMDRPEVGNRRRAGPTDMCVSKKPREPQRLACDRREVRPRLHPHISDRLVPERVRVGVVAMSTINLNNRRAIDNTHHSSRRPQSIDPGVLSSCRSLVDTAGCSYTVVSSTLAHLCIFTVHK